MSARRGVVAGAALVLVGLCGCSQRPLAQAARLLGVNELVLVGDYVFSTSTDQNELRVLDLAPDAVQGRQFLPAPNPLEPLSIPVVSRPTSLARDVRWEDTAPAEETGRVVPGGVEIAGPYVYAAAAGGVEISVVGAAPELLRELTRLVAPAPVTAMTARGGATRSTLAYATWDGARALLVTVDLPGPDALPAETAASLAQRTRVLDALPGESVAALLWLPGDRLVVATRKALGTQGRTLVLDVQSLATRELPFGAPVRMLATHRGIDDGVTLFPAGFRVFGVLDEEACGSPACGGVLAVDVDRGAVSTDATGQPMLPIRFGDALVQGLALGPGANLNLPPAVTGADSSAALPLSVLGVATTSMGGVAFFDAWALTHIDTDGQKAQAVSAAFVYPPQDGSTSPRLQNWVQGPVLDDPTTADVNESTLELADGAANDEFVAVVVEGQVPGLADLPTADADGLRLHMPVDVASRALPGDLAVLSAGQGVCGEAPLAQVDTAGALLAAVPAGCTGRTSYTVRAGPQAPYVVAGTVSGYMGRSGPDREFSFAGRYFLRYLDFDASRPALRVRFGPGEVAPVRDSRWVLELDNGFLPYIATVDSSVGCAAHMPGTPIVDLVRQRLFVAYPSANGVMEINPSVAGRAALTSGVYCYR